MVPDCNVSCTEQSASAVAENSWESKVFFADMDADDVTLTPLPSKVSRLEVDVGEATAMAEPGCTSVKVVVLSLLEQPNFKSMTPSATSSRLLFIRSPKV